MANFLQSLFGTSQAGFFGRLFGGGKSSQPESSWARELEATQRATASPRLSRLEPARGTLAELLAPHPAQTGALPPPRPPEQTIEITSETVEMPKPPAPQEFLQELFPPAPEGSQADRITPYDEKTDRWLRSGEWLYVHSSNVKALKYEFTERNLLVAYKNGYIYRYYEVPSAVAVDFTYSLSPGHYRWHVLGDPRWGTTQYAYTEITGAHPRDLSKEPPGKKSGKRFSPRKVSSFHPFKGKPGLRRGTHPKKRAGGILDVIAGTKPRRKRNL